LRKISIPAPIYVSGVARKAVAVLQAVEWWERGVALAEAPNRFAPPSLATPVLAARPVDSGELAGGMKMLADQEEWNPKERQTIKEGLDGVRDIIENVMAVGSLNYERSRHVASLILAKKAVAVGFPNGATKPQIIPAYIFETHSFIKWGKSEVVGNGLHFVSVKVAKLRRSEQLPEIPIRPKKNMPLKVGRRPSSEITDIIHELNMDPGFGKLPRKSQAELVIKKASEKYPKRFSHGKGLHFSTVCRYLHQELDA